MNWGKRIRSAALTLGFTLFLGQAHADVISLHKGISTDIWMSWPNEEQLAKRPELIADFPEWLQQNNQKQIANLRKAGFDFVRLTVDPLAYLWNPSAVKTATLNAGVLAAIKAIRAENLNVLVDFHAIPKGGDRKIGTETFVATQTAFDGFVAQAVALASSLSTQDPMHVALEPINEPVLDCDYDEGGNTHRWRVMALQLHNAVRNAAPAFTLVMQGACWGGSNGLVDLDPTTFEDANIIWDFHSYDPFLFTHQGAEWQDGVERYISGLHFPPRREQKSQIIANTIERIKKSNLSASRKAELVAQTKNDLSHYFEPGAALALHASAFKQVAEWAKIHNIPPQHIMLGEFGANRTPETAKPLTQDRLAFVERSRKEAEKRGYSWAFWNWSGSMSPTNNDHDRIVLLSYIKALGLIPQN